MASPRILLLRAPGTNCEAETAFAFERAGGVADTVHVERLLGSPGLLDEHQVLCIPGGFSYGDDIAAGRIFANHIRGLADAMQRFREAGKLILGICNGFQVLLKSGLLDTEDDHGPLATLTWNTSGRYTDRWVNLEAAGERCVFLEGIERLELPIAHAEGRFIARDEAALASLQGEGRDVVRYAAADGGPVDNPNGSEGDVAGVCDRSGRVLGLMPHPERFISAGQHPRWTRGGEEPEGAGLAVFRNAVRFASEI